MLRQIMIPDQQRIVVELPEEYVHQTVEILAFSLSENEVTPIKKNMKDTLALFAKHRGLYKGGFDREAVHER